MNKKQLYKLDEIGFIGTQKKVSALEKKRIIKKTGEIFQAARKASGTRRAKKAS